MNSYTTFIVKRLLLAILTVFIVTILAFLVMRLIPGDPVRAMLGTDAEPEYVEKIRHELYLDLPLPQQYILWLKDILHGNFGHSILTNDDVVDVVKTRMPITLSIGIPATIIGTILGVILGVVCATKRGSVIDQILTFLTTTIAGMPTFWVGIMLMYFFGVKLKWLPVFGYKGISAGRGTYLRYTCLPVIVLCLGPMTGVARQTRTNMIEIINQDYVRTARAYGLPEKSVLYKHALKNAMIPVVTMLAGQIRMVVGGAVLVETVYAIAGMGRTLTTALNSQDFITIQACILMIAMITVIVNLILDLVYGFLDPRIRKSQQGA